MAEQTLRATTLKILADEGWTQFQITLMKAQPGKLTPTMLGYMSPFYKVGFIDGFNWQEEQGNKGSDIRKGAQTCWQREYSKAYDLSDHKELFTPEQAVFFQQIFNHGFVEGIARFKEL